MSIFRYQNGGQILTAKYHKLFQIVAKMKKRTGSESNISKLYFKRKGNGTGSLKNALYHSF
jgi:hypothetical protein